MMMKINLIDKAQNVVWSFSPIDARDHMSYMGGVRVPCPNGHYPRICTVREGLEYWMSFTFPVNDEWKPETIEFVLDLFMKKEGKIYPKTIISIVAIDSW